MTSAWEAGTAYVTVQPSIDNFQKKLREQLSHLNSEFEMTPAVSAAKAKAEVEKAAKAASGAKATFDVEADTDEAEAQIGAFARRAQQRLHSALRSLPEIDLDADTTRADRKVDKLRERMLALQDKTIGVNISGEDFERELNKIENKLRKLGENKDTTLQLRVDTDAASKALDSYRKQNADKEDQAYAEEYRRAVRAWDALGKQQDAALAMDFLRRKNAVDAIAKMQDQAQLIDRKRTQQSYDDLWRSLDARGELQQKAFDEDRKRAQRAADEAAKLATAAAEREKGSYARAAEKQVDNALRALPKTEVTIDSTEAERQLATLRNELDHLSGKRIGIDIDSAGFEAELKRIQAELAKVATNKTASIQVKADVGKAIADLALADRAVSKLDGRKASANFDVTGVARALAMIGLLTTAMAAVSAAAVPAVAAVAGLGLLAGAAGQGLTALVVGLSGVGGAVKALNDERDKSEAGTKTSAAAEANSAQAIISAQRALQQTQTQADRASIQGAQQVGDARKALAEAQTSAAARIEDAERGLTRAREQSADQITTAERGLANAREQAADRAATAERAVTSAQENALEAQESLNRAREAAVERLEDLKLALRDVALDEREAAVQQRAAELALATGIAHGITGDPLERLRIQAEKAQLALDTTRERAGDLNKEQAKYNKDGVDGSDAVVAAQRRVTESTAAVAKAQADQVKAQRDNTRQIADAERTLAKAHTDSAREIADAERTLAKARADGAREVSDAQDRIARAQQAAGWAQADAAASVLDAQRRLADAYVDAGNKGTAASDRVAEAMANLSPAGRKFALFLSGELLPALHGIRDGVQATLLPRLETSFRTLLKIGPELRAGLAQTGEVIGDLAIRGADMMTSGPWRADFKSIMANNNIVLKDFGLAGLSVADALRNIFVAAGPMVLRFADFARSSMDTFASWIQGKRVTGELTAFFTAMGDELAKLWDVLTSVAGGLGALILALAPLGDTLLSIVAGIADLVGWVSTTMPLLVRLAAVFVILSTGTVTFARGIGGTIAAFRSAGGVISSLMPTAVSTAIRSGFDSVALGAGNLTKKLGGTEAASNKVISAGGKLSDRASKLGAGLPLVGFAIVGVALATDALNSSFDEMSAGMAQGGVAAERMRAELANNDAGLERSKTLVGGYAHYLGFDWVRAHVVGAQTTDEFNKKLAQSRAEMGPLAAAQQDVTTAQNNYMVALQRFPPGSAEVVTAAGRLATAVDRAKVLQEQATTATQGHTDALKRQSDQMLGSINADLASQASKLAVEQSQKALTEAVRLSGAGSLEARSAEVQYQQSLTASVTSSGDAARAANEHKGATEADRAALQAQNDEVWRLVGLAGGAAPPALLAMAAGMTNADLTARGATVTVNALGQRIVSLPGGPGQPPFTVTIDAYTGPAQEALNRFVVENNGRKIDVIANMMTPQGVPIRQLGGGAIGAVVDALARGGIRSMSNRIAQAVPANTPRLIGDRIRGREYFLPDDSAPRTMAIGAQWAHDRGLQLAPASAAVVPLAGGGILDAAARMAGGGILGTGVTQPLTTIAVPLDPEAASDALRLLTGDVTDLTDRALMPLGDTITDVVVPALAVVADQAGVKTALAFTTLQATLPPLTAQSVATSLTLQNAWIADTRGVQAFQASHNASWASMTATSGGSIGTITGPQFGALHAGLDGMVHGFDIASGNIGNLWGRLRGYVAEPIRWSLQFPINVGLKNAWGEIDKFFDLRKPWGGVPVAGFAEGSEDHRAQIAQGGALRVWAEDETGGEAYIPLALSKRRRSSAILDKVAEKFGMQLMPRDVRLFADGGLWRQMFGIVRRQFPGATLNSSYRAGDPGYHGSGRATDLGGDMPAINKWLANSFANSTELIHTPGINLWHGAPHQYNAQTQADHRSHVHWAMASAAMLGGAKGNYTGPDGAGGGIDISGVLNEKLAGARTMMADIQKRFGNGSIAVAMTRMVANSIQAAVDLATNSYAPSVGPPGAGVERWRPLVRQSLGMINQPLSFDNITLRRMDQESGGNERAINLSDSNARKGTPSKGLMQVIQPTFDAYKDARAPNDIWNPLSNLLASERYALARYSSLPAAYNRAGGYDNGGMLPPGYSSIYNGTGKPEPVLTDQQWKAISGTVRGGDSGGSVTYHIHEASDAASIAAEVERTRRFTRRLGVGA